MAHSKIWQGFFSTKFSFKRTIAMETHAEPPHLIMPLDRRLPLHKIIISWNLSVWASQAAQRIFRRLQYTDESISCRKQLYFTFSSLKSCDSHRKIQLICAFARKPPIIEPSDLPPLRTLVTQRHALGWDHKALSSYRPDSRCLEVVVEFPRSIEPRHP